MANTTSSETNATLAVGALLPLFLVIVVAPLVLIRAFVLSKLWNWYAAPYFGLHHLQMVFAFGFSLIVSFLIVRVETKKADDFWYRYFLSLAAPFLVLLSGWIGTLFI